MRIYDNESAEPKIIHCPVPHSIYPKREQGFSNMPQNISVIVAHLPSLLLASVALLLDGEIKRKDNDKRAVKQFLNLSVIIEGTKIEHHS